MARSWTPSQEAAMSIKGKNLLVSAAAGSGKTSVLTERIIRSLLDRDTPADLSRMLIVTFTRAAAAELKGRIAEALSAAMAEDPENEHLSRQLFLLGSAQISTIDSFFQKAVRANFEQLSLPASFRLADEKELSVIKYDVLSDLLTAYYKKHDKKKEDAPSIEGISQNDFALVLDNLMSGRSDGKLHQTLLDFYECFSSDPLGVGRLEVCAKDLEHAADCDYFESSFGKEVCSYLLERFSVHEQSLLRVTEHLGLYPELAQKYTPAVDGDLRFCRMLLHALNKPDYASARACVFDTVLSDLPRGRIQKTEEIVLYQARRKKFKSDISRAAELLKTPAEEIPSQMKNTAFVLSMLHSFYKDYSEALLCEKREKGVFEHNDVRAMLYSMLNEADGSPTPFAKDLAKEYDAVYIDEYQDVDLIQDSIFARIGEKNRFMVGDIKQSIYGFRGSDPSIFANYRRAFPLYHEEGAKNAEGVCVFMSDNFRCNESVIRFANRVCGFLFSACERSIGYREEDDLVFSKRTPDTLPEGHPVPVVFSVFDPGATAKGEEEDEDDENNLEIHEEALWTAAEISRLLREGTLDNGERITPNDIAILTQTRRPWGAYIKALKDLNIPTGASVRSELLSDPILITTLNLLRAVDNPYRDLPLTEFLLSELGGFTLAELTELRVAAGRECAVYDALTQGASKDGELAVKVNDFLTRLMSFRKYAAVQSADKFLRLLYLDPAFVPYATSPALLFLYDQARLAQASSFHGLYEFLAYFSKLMESGKLSADGFKPPQSAVTLMSVHHSKGLEFPVVFVCSTGTQFNKDDLKKTLVYHRDLGAATKLFNRESGCIESTVLHDAVKLRIDLDGNEEHIRTLYVALTRARERLYVTGTLRGKWENALSSAAEITYKNRSAILDAGTTLKWMLAAMNGADDDFPCRLLHHPQGSVEAGIPLKSDVREEESTSPTDEASLRYARIQQAAKDFVYPEQLPNGIPSKLAASKLHGDVLDTLTDADDTSALSAQIELMRASPTFEALLSNSQRASAADIGSAMHAFLEFCDFKSLHQNGVEAECERLQRDGFITKDQVSLLQKSSLEAFCNSDLMSLILEAEECRREQTFGILIPMEELTRENALANRLRGQRMFVQGSIDLILRTKDGRIILVDYKTDRLTAEEKKNPALYKERIATRHRDQLVCYARAIKELFGKTPDDVRIYSVPLGSTVSVCLCDKV